jgi:hypothetical protein
LALGPDHFIHVGNSRRVDRAALGRASSANCERTRRQRLNSEHRKNGCGFPVFRSNHQRIVAGIAFSSEVGTGSHEENASRRWVAALMKWRQVAAIDESARQQRKQKGRREAGLFQILLCDAQLRLISVLCDQYLAISTWQSPGHPNGS